MASPFVPVDLDKLLDEFEEKEEDTKAEQANIAGRKQLANQGFQTSFPSIEEEVLSDQGSDRCTWEDKGGSDTDSDSISGVIKEAEAITNQSSLSCQQQRTPGVVGEITDKLQENVTWYTPMLSSDVNGFWNRIEGSNSEGFDLNEKDSVQKLERVQVLNEESEALPVGLCKSAQLLPRQNVASNIVSHFTETNSTSDVFASTSEHCDESSVIGSANEERHQSVEDETNPVESGGKNVGQFDTCTLGDSAGRTGEPEMLIASVGDVSFDSFNQVADSKKVASVNLIEQAPGLPGNQATHGPGSRDDQETCTLGLTPETGQLSSLWSTEISSEAASNTNSVPTFLVSDSDSSHSQEHVCYSNVNSDVQPFVPSQDQSETMLDESGACTSDIPEAPDTTIRGTEVNEPMDSETQIFRYQQIDMASDFTQSVPDQGIPSTEYSQVNAEVSILDEGSVLPLNEVGGHSQSPSQVTEPDLTVSVQAQGTAEAQRITAGQTNLGKVPPIWVPDSVATHCMNCGVKFSVIKRRHHCRACGKALCSSCCNMKFLLPYMENKEGRVCQVCCNALLRAEALMHVVENQPTENTRTGYESLTEDLILDDGLEGDEEVSLDQEEELTEVAEAVGDDSATGFAAAEVDLTSERSAPVLPPLQLPFLPPPDLAGTPLSTPTSPALSDDSDCLFRLDVDNVRSLLPQDISALPPVLKIVNQEISIQERPDPAEIMYQIKGLHQTVVFLLNKNLVVKVSKVKLSCCVKRKCWCFVSEGMGAANQEEMVVLLECLRKETMLPKDVLSHFNTAFAYAKQGHTVSELGYTIFGQPFLGSSDNAGFLYVKPTYQCLKNLPLPSTPYVVGILIKRQETPWAQLFPLRLQLRLGAEYRYYPCPLFSSRNRSAVYGEVGHTIMNLLADFKNFQYTLARVTGLVIHMEEKKTLVRLPQDRYDEVVKILNASDEHVMALGANFSLQADSHLVCMQSEQGYKTQAINIQNQPRKVTGASFIVFSGALKTSSPFTAKVNIVEDGILVQLMPEVIGKLRNALKEMKDYTITTGIPGGGGEEQVILEWVSRKDTPNQSSVCSPIDGLQLDGFSSVKVHTGCDFTRKSVFRIQWTEMYFLGEGQQSASRDINKLTAELAKAFCRTLMPHLSKLSSEDFACIGLRVNVDTENVGYFTGSNQESLPGGIMSDLDDVLVPIIHNAASHHRRRALSVELLFKVLRL